LDVLCPRCRTHIHPGEDHCPSCGLTVDQLEQLIHTNSARLDAAATRPAAPEYYSLPTYGHGPAQRSMGPSPKPPRVNDLRRDDTVINLAADGSAELLMTTSGATVPLPPSPTAPPSRPPARTGHRVELLLLIAVVLVAGAIIAALLRLSS
jgi:hypothetical protein